MSSAWPPVPATIWPSRSTCIVCTRCCACGCRTGSASDHAAHAAQRPRYRAEDADRSDLSEVQLRRSEEHTSELQSHSELVCRLLLEKKKAGLRREAVQPDIEAERKMRDEIEAGKSYCIRRFGGATCDDKFFFFFNDTATTEIYTLSLHDALPIFINPATRAGASLVIALRPTGLSAM